MVTMLLPQTAEYAFRAMSCLVGHYRDGAIRSKDLSEQANIPPFYLSKIMRRLVIAGLVTSQRGHGGGFRLARPPADICFLDILNAVDYQAEMGRCAFGIGKCNPDNPCPLHPAWSALQANFLTWARSNRLDSLTDRSFRIPTGHDSPE